eukprot:scaffold958_cov97-Alexandrium_tamarense.AAC.3
MGVQVVVFILRSRWEYLWWFFIYFTVGLPVFYLILPTYSFWNMDDFSWGKTRSVGGSAANNAAAPVEELEQEEDDEKRGLYEHEEDRSFSQARSVKSAHSMRSGVDDDERSTTSSSTSSSGGSDDDESSDNDSEYSDESGSDDESEYSQSRASQSQGRY